MTDRLLLIKLDLQLAMSRIQAIETAEKLQIVKPELMDYTNGVIDEQETELNKLLKKIGNR